MGILKGARIPFWRRCCPPFSVRPQGHARKRGLSATPTGELIGNIHLPETCTNLCFGGTRKNGLFMCSSPSIYAVYVEAVGALVP
jgi:sugar lactone lactonase YvrE